VFQLQCINQCRAGIPTGLRRTKGSGSLDSFGVGTLRGKIAMSDRHGHLLREMGERSAHEVHTAALPGGVQHLGNRGLDSLVAVRDDEFAVGWALAAA
jgi:hypothetical protein